MKQSLSNNQSKTLLIKQFLSNNQSNTLLIIQFLLNSSLTGTSAPTRKVAGVLTAGTGWCRTTNCTRTLRKAVWIADIVWHGWLLYLLVWQQGRIGWILAVSWYEHWRQHCNYNNNNNIKQRSTPL